MKINDCIFYENHIPMSQILQYLSMSYSEKHKSVAPAVRCCSDKPRISAKM